MRKLTFAVLAYVATVIQVTLLPLTDVTGYGVRPDLLLLVALFYALHGRDEGVILGGWALGLLADLTGLGRVGVHAFAFGMVVMATFHLRMSLNRESAWVHAGLGLLAGAAVNFWAVFMLAVTGGLGPGGFAPAAGRALACAALTAIAAPYLFWGMSRFRGYLGLHYRRYRRA